MASLKWYINRLKIMSSKEIIHRLICKLYDKKIEYGLRLKEDKYNVKYIDLPKFVGGSEEENQELINNAENILNNKIIVFDQYFDFNYKEKFLVDPITKLKWDSHLYTKVSFRKVDIPGDPKLIWEINKQQYLLDLGVAYQLTSNEKYSNKIIKEINEWIRENEEYKGINWTSGLEIALRCLSWIYSISLIKEYIQEHKININNILHYIRIQTEFIFNKLSLYSSANNHLIGELTLLLYSSYFMDCKESGKWRSKATKMLNEQIDNQFYDDGINKEQSVNYQIHTMELYFLSQYLLEKNKSSLSEKVLSLLKKACFYLDKLSESDGTVFNIGDEDGGHVLKLQSNPNGVLDILQIGALTLRDLNIYKNKEKVINNKALMLYGIDFKSLIEENFKYNKEKSDSYIFKSGGMFIKDGNINNIPYKACFDFGEIGMAPLNAHAHCDILSFNLNIDGAPFLIDCGTYKYHKDDGFRNYFRGVTTHNTISINNKNQFEFLGPFICEKTPVVKLINNSDEKIECSTNMYKKLKCDVRRELIFNNDSILIIDKIHNLSSKSINVKNFFNFDSNVIRSTNLDKESFIINNKEVIFENYIKSINLKDNKYEKKLEQSWMSSKYYYKEKTLRLVYDFDLESNTYLEKITKILIGGKNDRD